MVQCWRGVVIMGKDKVMTAVGYIRVSTEDQAKEGLSLDAQADRILGYCTAKEWELTDMVTDAGLSGKDLDRPGVQKVISLCRDKAVDVVIVVKLDRITRNVRDLGFLLQDVFDATGVMFASITDNLDTTSATGRLVVNMIGSVAQWEREIIAERTRDTLAHKKKNGEWVGRPPVGYQVDGDQLAENADAQAHIRKVRRMRKSGKSIRVIAGKLNMSISTVWRILSDGNGQRKRKYNKGEAKLTVS